MTKKQTKKCECGTWDCDSFLERLVVPADVIKSKKELERLNQEFLADAITSNEIIKGAKR